MSFKKPDVKETIVLVEPKFNAVSPKMVSNLRTKIIELNKTGIFEVSQEVMDKLSNFRTYIGYITSLRSYADLKKIVDKTGKSNYQFSKLKSIKTGMEFLLNIENNVNLLKTTDLVTLGRFLKKQKNTSSETEIIVRDWALYREEVSNAVFLLEEKHNGFIDIYKRKDEVMSNLFKYLLTEKKSISEIIEQLEGNEVNYLSNTKGFFRITSKELDNNSRVLKNEELPIYVISYLFEEFYKDQIDAIIEANHVAQAEVVKKEIDTQYESEVNSLDVPSDNDDYEDNEHEAVNSLNDDGVIETSSDGVIITSDEYIESLDDNYEETHEVNLANTKNPTIMLTAIDPLDEKKAISSYLDTWKKAGLNDSKSKAKLLYTMLVMSEAMLEEMEIEEGNINKLIKLFKEESSK